MTLIGPYSRVTLRSSGRVIVWSPPKVMTRGSVLPFFDGPGLSESVFGFRERMLLWPSSICLSAYALSYLHLISFWSLDLSKPKRSTHDVTGMSPQSITFAQELNGFASSGTLYPPLNPTFREPFSPDTRQNQQEVAY